MRLLLRVPRPPSEPYLLLPPERLQKARKGTDAAPRPGHKYIRRERAFVGGKLTWRYFYRDEQQRQKHAQELDPNKAHEHRLISELKKIHPELVGEPTLAKDSTIISIKEKFGAVKATVGSTPGWTDKIYAPSITREEQSPENAGRSPQARVHYAVEHFPEHLKELISEKTGAYHGLKDFLLELAVEDGLRAVLFGVAGWANKDGKLRITDIATCNPEGTPKFNSRLTWTEEVVWHELGHHVHFALEDKKTEVIDAWKKLHVGTGEKISAYAHTNWMEDWAESFACSISFPKQLATECPERYDFMREHVMPEMLPRAEILKRSDEELAWWESAKKTPAALALAQARKDYPARRYFPYYSDKDQFYMVSRNGRSVMLRFGPPDKESEAGWERMPDVVDPETGLPKYEGGSFTRFNAYEFLKEIYDERGRPLDSRQAYLYLGIDDDKVNAIVTETVGKDGAPRDYSQKVYESGSNDSRHLGRKMFDALGGNLADATIEKERARVVRAKEKGKPVVMERHDWTPVEITEREFRDKSGTFKFGAIREAAEQPHVLYDIVEGKKQTRTYFDGASQSWKPVLAVRIYEQQNPDGTLTRIMVHEDSAFRAGETILAPSEDGWERYVVKENDPLEPELLALQLGTSARALLDANHRYGRGQIMDPVLSALLNPGSRRQIRCAADLQELMRAAAESDVPRRAWVAVAGGSRNTEGAAFSHIEVEWDGSGPPIVVGDYWARKLDKQPPVRIDELLEKTGQLKLPRIVERKAESIPVELGNYAFAIDPKTGRKVMVHIVERKAFEDETEQRFGVQALPGQGAGVDRTVRYLRRRDLVAATGADVPGQPTIVRRIVLPLEHDVLLYADNVARGSGPNDPGGLIRIMLPTDGSLSMEMLRRMPGVREPAEGELFATIAVEDIPRFRAALGGFVMDGRVRASLQAAAEDERQRFEQAAEDPLVKPEQLVGADGNLAPDGLLQNLVLGNEGIQPGPHRIKALQKLAQNNGRLIAAHFMGCLSGETRIPVNRCGKGFSMSIAELFQYQNALRGKWDPDEPTYAQSLFGERHVRLNEVLSVVESGMQETFRLTTKSGRTIRATAMHPFWTPSGWVALGDLNPGDKVGVMGLAEARGRAPKAYKYGYRTALYHHPYAGVRGAKASPYRVPTHRLVAEARLNSLELEDFVRRCREGHVQGLRFLDPRAYAVHHKNENTLDNSPDNLEVLPHEEHWRLHGEQKGWTNFTQFRVEWDEVTDVGFEIEEPTYDICMHASSQSYVANEFVVHNTGKTPFAIMAAEMMRNLTDREGKPHPNQTTKKTIFVVPLNTAENWYQEFKRFAAPPTLLGTSSLAGAQQIPKLPEHKTGESDSAFAVRAIAYWKEQCKQKPGLWNPFTDPTRNVVIGSKYFFDHEEALRLIDQFDGMVVDEAHMIARDNGISRAVERWNPNMKMWVGLTGTPIMNTLSVLPRVVRLVTAGRKDLGTEAQFSEKYLVPSAIMLEAGAKHPPRIDINPMRAGELAAILQPIMDVATTTDVKGQAMPAVLLDENEPAHMIGQQARMYRAAMARLSEEEREALALSASLGIDEKQMLSEAARARVNVARATANCPAYKAPDLREVITFEAMVPKPPKKGGGGKQDVGFTKQDVPFRLPGYDIVGGKGPQGWRGKWPSAKDVEKGRIEPGYYAALLRYGELLFGKAYEYIEGTSIEPNVLAAIKKGNYVTPSGHAWGSLANNPDYGPEGMTARGQLDVKTGDIIPLSYAVEDEHGVRHVKELKTGTRFVRDPNRKAAGLFYHQDDWDSTGRFEDTGEEGGGEDEEVDEESAEGEEEAGKGKKKKTAREQGPKPGRENMSIQRSPARREQRAMFDAAVTVGNAKCDKLEGWVKNVLSGKTGDPNPERAQFIIFGNRIGSSCRTVEAKLRTMGYQDVNEALGPPEYSSEADKKKLPSKFFVSYLGHGATLGNRNLNSEIFRRAQDGYGADLGASVFTWRTLYGSSGKALKSGEVREGWGRTERKKISECFRDEHGDPLEMPMRVRGGEQGAEYVYESSLKGGERREVKAIEVQMRSASTKERKALEARLNQILEPHYSKKPPLNARQQHVFNNCQFMVASDAANVGLNWPSGYLGMYDSLFSPMAEWQRITRAARMLPPGVPREIRGIVEKIDAAIRENEGPYQQPEYNEQTAMETIELAILGLPKEDQDLLRNIPGGRAEQIVEGYFARRALDKIAGLREEVAHKLRQEGYYPDPNAPKDAAHWISPVAVTDVDVANYIVRERLTNFERKMMRARRYLVEVQRFTTSVEVPEYTRVTVTDPLTGKKRRVRVPKLDEQGNPVVYVESPCQAEKSQLTQSRAKQKPFEVFMHVVKHAVPVETRFDFVPASANGLGITSLPSGQAAPGPDDLTDYLGEGFMQPKREEAKKSFYVRAPRFVAHLA